MTITPNMQAMLRLVGDTWTRWPPAIGTFTRDTLVDAGVVAVRAHAAGLGDEVRRTDAALSSAKLPEDVGA